jgi:hypothetical protein
MSWRMTLKDDPRQGLVTASLSHNHLFLILVSPMTTREYVVLFLLKGIFLSVGKFTHRRRSSPVGLFNSSFAKLPILSNAFLRSARSRS